MNKKQIHRIQKRLQELFPDTILKQYEDVYAGCSITDCIERARLLAIFDSNADTAVVNTYYWLTFNDCICVVAASSDVNLLQREYSRGAEKIGADPKLKKLVIRPFPPVELTADQKANDAAIDERRAIEREKDREEYAAAEKQKALELEGKIACIHLELRDGNVEWDDKKTEEHVVMTTADYWAFMKEKNSDPYGAAAFNFADQWARLMQYYIQQGETLEACFSKASHEADTDGITGFMYGCAKSLLRDVWVHGAELNKLDNH